MPIEVSKIDDNTLGVIETKPAEILSIVHYDYTFLKEQLVRIQAQKDRDNALRDAEIVNIVNLLAEADKLGIVAATADNVIKEG